MLLVVMVVGWCFCVVFWKLVLLFSCGLVSHFLRDYMAEVEAAITAKLATWKIQHLGLWVDLVEQPSTPPKVLSAVEVMELEDEAATAKFREVRAKLAQDTAQMCKFNADKEEATRRSHVVKVMHEKSQLEIGNEFLGCALFNFGFGFPRGCFLLQQFSWLWDIFLVWLPLGHCSCCLWLLFQHVARLCEAYMERGCRVTLLTDKSWLEPRIDSIYRSAALASKVREQNDCLKPFWNHYIIMESSNETKLNDQN